MAEIWVDRKCSKCGQQVTPGQKALLIATVNTTQEVSYGNYQARARKVRVNFFANSPRELQHIECPAHKHKYQMGGKCLYCEAWCPHRTFKEGICTTCGCLKPLAGSPDFYELPLTFSREK